MERAKTHLRKSEPREHAGPNGWEPDSLAIHDDGDVYAGVNTSQAERVFFRARPK